MVLTSAGIRKILFEPSAALPSFLNPAGNERERERERERDGGRVRVGEKDGAGKGERRVVLFDLNFRGTNDP